jgi:hypothetical protein
VYRELIGRPDNGNRPDDEEEGDEDSEDEEDEEDSEQDAKTDDEVDAGALEATVLERLLAEPDAGDTPMWYVRTFVSLPPLSVPSLMQIPSAGATGALHRLRHESTLAGYAVLGAVGRCQPYNSRARCRRISIRGVGGGTLTGSNLGALAPPNHIRSSARSFKDIEAE